jgi:hypothetical protein
MNTEVTQTYGLVNLSITKRDGRIDRVTTWLTGVKGSTVVRTSTPRKSRR